MRPSATVLLVLLLALSGCSQLAEPAEEPTSTPTGPIEGTASPAANGTQPTTGGNVGTPTPTASRSPSPTPLATATATAISTATPTLASTTPSATRTPSPTQTTRPIRTPARPPTATRTPTATTRPTTVPSTTTAATATASRTTALTPNSGRLVLGRIDADGEAVTLRNAGGRSLDLGGYVVDFDDGQRYPLPAYTLRPGRTVTIHTGRGDNTRNDLYAGFLYPVINDDGDTVLVETPNGRIVAARQVG